MSFVGLENCVKGGDKIVPVSYLWMTYFTQCMYPCSQEPAWKRAFTAAVGFANAFPCSMCYVKVSGGDDLKCCSDNLICDTLFLYERPSIS